MAAVFDPKQHSALVDLEGRLRELAGDAAYAAGRDYQRRGLVKETLVAGARAEAVVSGSTDYRVNLGFNGEVKPACTCPAHRRNRYCKHVVAVCVALIERPASFKVVAVVEAPRAEPPPKRERKPKGAAEAVKAEQRTAGLLVVDRVIDELAAGGAAGLGREQLQLLESAAETVRALKLRRLGNLLMALRRLGDSREGSAESESFARLLRDLWLTRRMVGAHLHEAAALDPALAEELIGKTWREADLEKIGGLELMTIAQDCDDDGEFRVDSTYLADLSDGHFYVERQIVPRGLRGDPLPARRFRLLVDEAGLYPGLPPRRLKLLKTRREPLTLADVDRFVAGATEEIPAARARLAAQLSVPYATSRVAAAIRPTAILTTGDRVVAVDRTGQALPLVWPDAWRKPLPPLLPEELDRLALVGLLRLDEEGATLHCLAVVGRLSWAHGPIFPDNG